MHRVIFKPADIEIEHTEMGPGFDPRAPAQPRDPFERFPFAAAVAAGIPYLRDVAEPADHACLVQIEDDELVDAIDLDRMTAVAMERFDDTVVHDVEYL